jgi:hypothetical protein
VVIVVESMIRLQFDYYSIAAAAAAAEWISVIKNMSYFPYQL